MHNHWTSTSNLFYGTGIPTAILIFFKRNRKDKLLVLFIDARKEFQRWEKSK